MKKMFRILTIILMINFTLIAMEIDNFTLSTTTFDNVTIQFQLPELQITNEANYTKVQADGITSTSDIGFPELPKFSTLYQVEPTKEYSIDFTIINSHIIENVNISSFQGYDLTEKDGLLRNNDFYQSNQVYPENNLLTSNRMIMRDIELINIEIIPFSYSPETQTLEVFDEIELHVTETGSRSGNEITIPKSRTFEKLYSDLVINYTTRDGEYQDPAILYICGGNIESNPSFIELVNWRHQRGYVVYTASTSETGTTTTDIKNYIANAYSTLDPTPEFVALVGDVGGSFNLPTFYEDFGNDHYNNDCEGDHPYSQLNGTDLLPEVLIGRISIRSPGEMVIITNKIIHYEKATYLGEMDGYYEKAALIGDPSSSGNSTMITNEYVGEILSAYGFEDVRTNLGEGNYSNWMRNQLAEGVLYFNYRGYLGVSGFGSADINAANNGYKLPFATVLTCGTGSFAEDNACLSEAFLRAGSGSTPEGAVAAVSTATWNTHTMFNNIVDMGMYDGLFPKELETAGAALVNGKLALYSTFPGDPGNYVSSFTQWNNLMGDPSTHLFTDTPSVINANFESTIAFGTNYIEIDITDDSGNPISDAMITLLKGDDEIFGSTYSNESGTAIIDLNYTSDGDVTVTITKRNHKPFIGDFNIYTSNVSVNIDTNAELQISDGNNGEVNPGDIIELSIPLTNFGSETANNLTATLITTSELVEITTADAICTDLEPGESSYATPFIFTLSPELIDNEHLGLQVEISNGEDTWSSVIDIDVFGVYLVQASNIEIGLGGNIEVPITLQNLGSITAINVSGYLTYEGNQLSIDSPECLWNDLSPGESGTSYFNPEISVDSDVINGTIITLSLNLMDDNGYNHTEPIIIQVGNTTVTDPLGPDNYGYYIYDSGDILYDLAPIYDWVEINPSSGGDGTPLNLNDSGNGNYSNSVVQVDLPFTFKFYGVNYDEISICSNGWIAFGHSEMESFRNYPIPGAGGPVAMVAAFWDDLKTAGSGDAYFYHDIQNGYVVIEWANMRTYDENSVEDFQIILYDGTTEPYGDGDIKIQYKNFNNTTNGNYGGYTPQHGAYSTIGIENHLSNDGLQYTFNNTYPREAMELENETAIYISTGQPITLPAPSLTYTPYTMNFYVYPNDSDESGFSITNSGEEGSTMIYNVGQNYPSPQPPFETPGGGPDNSGYYWSDSNIDATISSDWIDISEDNSQVTFQTNDIATSPIEIGFPFSFYGEEYSEFIINPNGWVGFGDDVSTWTNISIPAQNAPKPAILGFWDDLNPVNDSNGSGQGNVFYHSNSERLVVWFDDVIHYPGEINGTYNFQFVLWANGDIDINYATVTGTTDRGTIGIQNAMGNDGIEVIHNDTYIQDNLSLKFKKSNSTSWLSIVPVNGDLQGELEMDETIEFVVHVNATQLEPETTYHANITISTNAQNAVSIPVVLTVSEDINHAPVSDAGIDQVVTVGDIVTLDASQSYDPDGNEMFLQWISMDGITLSDPTLLNPTFIAPEFDESTNLTFVLVITDGSLYSQADEVVITVNLATGLDDNLIPTEFSMNSAYPNPFNPATTVEFALPVDSKVNISVYDISGHLVSELVNSNVHAGYHHYTWNASAFVSGIYIVKLQANQFTQVRKVMLIK